MSAKILASGCVPAGAPARFLTASSSRLGGRADITLLLPPVELVRRPVSLMIVMHGLFGSHWNWLALGGLGDLAHYMWRQGVLPPLVIALPSDGLRGDGTGYLPTHDGDYESWILEDVPAAVANDTRLTDPSAPILLAGNSMGGYGALRMAAEHPHRVVAASAHSPITRFETLARYSKALPRPSRTPPRLGDILGPDSPPFRFDCGSGDELLGEVRALHDQLVSRGVAHGYEERPGGHDWMYWSGAIAQSLRFFADILRGTAPPTGTSGRADIPSV